MPRQFPLDRPEGPSGRVVGECAIGELLTSFFLWDSISDLMNIKIQVRGVLGFWGFGVLGF